jgi:indolepyruvate ferredoxin oxidoreductase
MAAHVQGLHAAGLEQTGLAQKGGPVISDVRISPAPISGQLRATLHSVDVLIGLDLLGAADPATIAMLDHGRTIAILNSDLTPTAAMVTDPNAPAASAERLIGRVRRHSRAATLFTIPAQTISERLFGDHLPVNLMLLGAAFQRGCLPLQAAAIERAIELNGTAVERNIEAFRWGRASAAAPALLERAMAPAGAETATPADDPRVMRILETAGVPARLRDVVARRASELIAYQDAGYAAGYAREVARVAEIERRQLDGLGAGIAEAHALGLFKLMAYKDEYEVARLHLDAVERARLEGQFGSEIRVQTLLHPPFLRSLGVQRKLKFGRSANPLFKTLRAARRLRGTALDPFGHTEVRRTERALIDEYRRLLDGALTRLTPATQGVVAELASLPELVRGYELIKLQGVARMRERASALTAQLDAAGMPSESPTYVAAA